MSTLLSLLLTHSFVMQLTVIEHSANSEAVWCAAFADLPLSTSIPDIESLYIGGVRSCLYFSDCFYELYSSMYHQKACMTHVPINCKIFAAVHPSIHPSVDAYPLCRCQIFVTDFQSKSFHIRIRKSVWFTIFCWVEYWLGMYKPWNCSSRWSNSERLRAKSNPNGRTVNWDTTSLVYRCGSTACSP